MYKRLIKAKGQHFLKWYFMQVDKTKTHLNVAFQSNGTNAELYKHSWRYAYISATRPVVLSMRNLDLTLPFLEKIIKMCHLTSQMKHLIKGL